MKAKTRIKTKTGETALQGPKLSRCAQDRLARLVALRDLDGQEFKDRDALDWAIRMAERQALRNAEEHESETLRNMALATALVETVGELVRVLTANYITNDEMRLYEYMGLKPRREKRARK